MDPLIDRFGRRHTYLRVSVTDRCNLRCRYCMPEEGIVWQDKNNLLSFEEIERLVRLFADLGITKVRLTGGEPLARHDLHLLVRKLHSIGGIEKLAMTTNATLLSAELPKLRSAGLEELTVSLDTLRPERFREITFRDEFETVWQGIESAISLGYSPIKLNVVLMGGVNEDEILDFVQLATERPILVRFIEYMPFKSNGWTSARLVPYKMALERIRERFEVDAITSEDPSFVAREFSVNRGSGTIGFITSMTEDFCSTCSRIRLTPDGAVKSCLHYAEEFSLRDAMRDGASDQDLEAIIRLSVAGKPERHAPQEELYQIENRTMIEIGG